MLWRLPTRRPELPWRQLFLPAELRAEARMLGVSRPVTQTEKQAMRIAFEAAHGGLEEAFELQTITFLRSWRRSRMER